MKKEYLTKYTFKYSLNDGVLKFKDSIDLMKKHKQGVVISEKVSNGCITIKVFTKTKDQAFLMAQDIIKYA